MINSLGAAAVFDYASPTCGQDILAFSGGQLSIVLDCVTTTASMTTCYEAIGSAGGRYLSLDPFPLRSHTRRSVKPTTVVCLTQFGRPLTKPYKRSARPQDREFAGIWLTIAEGLLADDKIKPHPHKTMPGGLIGIETGVELVRRGKVRGEKLVYDVCT
jgi:aspyridone synthetase trans-acting enoyl reductase